jgi:hypothetical protein
VRLAPDLLAGVDDQEPRHGLERAIERTRTRYSGKTRAQVEALGRRADDTLVDAVARSFRGAFAIAALLALLAAAAVVPRARGRRIALARVAVVALLAPVAYVLLHASIAPTPVKIADPCKSRRLPDASGISGVVQDAALGSLDRVACHFGSSREQLVLALADPEERRAYKRKYGVDPRSGGDLLQGLLGG